MKLPPGVTEEGLDLPDGEAHPKTPAELIVPRGTNEHRHGAGAATQEPLPPPVRALDADPNDVIGAPPVIPRAVGTILADVEPVRVSWLWPGRIPLGRLTVLDGDPGLGKSSLTLDLAARVTRGGSMPDGTRGLDGPAGVILLGAEDGLADTVRPRLDAAGADPSRVYALTGVRQYDDEDRDPRLPTVQDTAAIREAAAGVGGMLLVVDPLSAYMGAGVDGHRDIDVRTALAGLAQLAEATGLAVLLVRHLRKSGAANPLYAGGGSIAIIAAARSGLLLARDPDDDERLVLATTKGNLAPPQPSLGLRVVTTDDALRVEWTGPSARSAVDLLAVQAGPEARTARDEAAEWLRGELDGGPVAVADLRRTARVVGVSWRTVERAKSALRVVAERDTDAGGKVVGWSWRMPSSQSATGVGGLDGGGLDDTRMNADDPPDSTPQTAKHSPLAGWSGDGPQSHPALDLWSGGPVEPEPGDDDGPEAGVPV